MTYFLQGLLLGLAYVAPIGTQNLYVIHSAMRGNISQTIKATFITVFFDITLALACFFGLGYFIDRFFAVKVSMLFFGSIAVIYIGFKLITSSSSENKIVTRKSLVQIITTCFTVTWLNPQAIIDGTFLLGGYRASLPPGGPLYFIVGVGAASLLWFSALALFVSIFHRVFSFKILKVINVICGGIIILYGLKLGFTLLQLFY